MHVKPIYRTIILDPQKLDPIYKRFKVDRTNVKQLERFMLLLINIDRMNPQYRDETGGMARPLEWDEQLAIIGRAYSWDMALRNYFDHYSPEGKSVADRVSHCGISWKSVGENLAITHDIYYAHQGFMDEPKFQQNHRSNILNAQFHRLGIGIIKPANGRFFVTQVFSQ